MELAKDKAIELINNFMGGVDMPPPIFGLTTSEAKQCALIDIKGKIDMLETLHKPEYCTFNSYSDDPINGYEMIEFLEQVKQEIENL